MGFGTDYIVPIFTGVILMSFIAWLIFLVYLFLSKIGLFRWRKYRKLRKKLGRDYEFKDEILEFVNDAVDKKWRYKDMKRISANMPESDEILYTFFLMKKLRKKEK